MDYIRVWGLVGVFTRSVLSSNTSCHGTTAEFCEGLTQALPFTQETLTRIVIIKEMGYQR